LVRSKREPMRAIEREPLQPLVRAIGHPNQRLLAASVAPNSMWLAQGAVAGSIANKASNTLALVVVAVNVLRTASARYITIAVLMMNEDAALRIFLHHVRVAKPHSVG